MVQRYLVIKYTKLPDKLMLGVFLGGLYMTITVHVFATG